MTIRDPYDWHANARESQLAPTDPYWHTWVLAAGRGAGKTRALAEWVREEALKEPIKIIIVTKNPRMVEYFVDALIYTHRPEEMPAYKAASRRLLWPNGSSAFITHAEQPESLRGAQAHIAVGDDVQDWNPETLENLRYTVRLGPRPRIGLSMTPMITVLADLLKEASEDTPFQTRLTDLH